MVNADMHEQTINLSRNTMETHRAIRSLMEELDAVDWYQHRVEGTRDAGLRKVLAHNRDEKIEHAAMLIQWLQRNMPSFDLVLQNILFTRVPIAGHPGEEQAWAKAYCVATGSLELADYFLARRRAMRSTAPS